MAIKTEIYGTYYAGGNLIRTYSDAGYMIERDGVRYEEAIDPEVMGRTYVETDERIIVPEEVEEHNAREILDILLGTEGEGEAEGGAE